MTKQKHSPIVLFAYNRPRHMALVLDALKANPNAENSELIVFLDGPRNDEDVAAVTQVRKLTRNITGFRSVEIVARETNFGLADSIINGVTSVCDTYGRSIVLEDDIVVSPYFLDYLNTALRIYEETEQVISIGCFTFPVGDNLPDTFFFRVPDCWGWAVWKRSWDLFEPDGEKLLGEIKGKGLEREFDLNGAYPYTRMLADQVAKKNNSWAIRWYATAFLRNRLTLYPGRSMTRNIGMDGSGVHSGISTQYDAAISKIPVNVKPIVVEEHLDGLKQICEFLEGQQAGRFERIARRALSLVKRAVSPQRPGTSTGHE